MSDEEDIVDEVGEEEEGEEVTDLSNRYVIHRDSRMEFER